MTLSLERRAALWGDRTAVVDENADRRVSYADLESEADAMARRLSALGVESGDPVAVLSRNRVETLALLFATRRLGAVFAPVSYRLTPATVERPLAVVDPAVVVHESAQRDLIRELPDDLTYTFEEFGRRDGEAYERADPDPEDSLLYLHTKAEADRPAVGEDEGKNRPGESLNADPTTAPRVVDLPASTVEWNCITAAAAWGLGRGDCAPALLPLSDAEGLLRLTLPLLYVGGRVVLLRAFDPEDALNAVSEEGATALFAGATEYRELVESESFAGTDFGSVELLANGSALTADVRGALARHAPVVRTYGRVETGPNNLFVPPEGGVGGGSGDETTDGEASDDADPDRVGRPFPDCEARLVGEDGTPVADGEVGELQFRGPVTARGYLPDDGTADGDGGETFPEWVPTRDLATREGGDYYLLGRASETFDAASARVHPRAAEQALEAREGVDAAGVVPDAEGVLAAFVGDADPGELRSVLGDELPETVAVRELDRLESLPRRSTGELDRAALRRDLSGEERIDKE
ncbi:class I adenylate-forming enzyme family protein [Halorussus sp. MSC15.2]|uniref:class I adenylate-forming enzyme family protein n=1 Tax=Halorussus sp. MSC15.2 TaxID=2283638 RepID=UPI0013D44ACD|nr:AMP-binding protein [Halorussus sp. MSC15.2]NEU55410.1 long-chain fatty acid--CoA ligase [Halorussus sp. MSC15.2]